MQYLTMPLRGDEPHIHPLSLKDSVGCNGGSVENVLDLGHVDIGDGADFLGWVEGKEGGEGGVVRT